MEDKIIRTLLCCSDLLAQVCHKPNKTTRKIPAMTMLTKGELTIDDLPPIERLEISVSSEDVLQVGVISSVVDCLVVVQGLPGLPPLDLDTLLFVESGAVALGRVYDVLGPVTEPLYAVRFNTAEEARAVTLGAEVYCAPSCPQHTTYVFLSDLMRAKGSDASWKHNNEPPPACLDYSDDEQERKAKRNNRRAAHSVERNRRFEERMNNRNLLMSRRYEPVKPNMYSTPAAVAPIYNSSVPPTFFPPAASTFQPPAPSTFHPPVPSNFHPPAAPSNFHPPGPPPYHPPVQAPFAFRLPAPAFPAFHVPPPPLCPPNWPNPPHPPHFP